VKLLQYSDVLGRMPHQFEVFEDFLWYISPHMWTSLAADAGASVAVTAATDSGILAMLTGAVDNNEAAVRSTNAVWKFAAGKTVYCECLLQFTEAATNAANVCFGLSSAAGADLMVDDAAGPAASHTGALIYKTDGSTVWKTHTSNSTTQTSTTSLQSSSSSSYQKLGIEMRDVDGTNMEVTFFHNSLPLYADDSGRRPIKHSVAIASAAAMYLVAYVKAGSGSEETLKVDYMAAVKAR
jgi:hypothetical protein